MKERRGPLVGAVLAMLLAAITVGTVRWRLAERVRVVKETSDIFPLPPAEQLPVLSLGYHAALADLIWAQTLVLQGLRLVEKRRFDHGSRYFDSIFALEPTYRRPFLLLDSILSFSSKGATEHEIREVRRLHELGMKNRPTDAQLFLQAGNFLAYIAPSVLPESEHESWRLAGGKLLVKAAELSAGQTNVQIGALAGAGLLNRAGEREAAILFLERTYEITEDPEVREEILRQLGGLRGQAAAERAQASAKRFDVAWRGEFPFISRAQMLLVGPSTDTYGCVGGQRATPSCARDWKTWTELQNARRR